MTTLGIELYTEEAVERARDDAWEWLHRNDDGYPRTWEEESGRIIDGVGLFDCDFCDPAIAGYECLEREGLVTRLQDIEKHGQIRAHFRLTEAGRAARKFLQENGNG